MDSPKKNWPGTESYQLRLTGDQLVPLSGHGGQLAAQQLQLVRQLSAVGLQLVDGELVLTPAVRGGVAGQQRLQAAQLAAGHSAHWSDHTALRGSGRSTDDKIGSVKLREFRRRVP